MENETAAPRKPDNVEDTGLDFHFLAELALKTVYSDTNCTTERVAQKLRVPMAVADPLLQHLYHEKLVEIRGEIGFQNHRYAMMDRGWERVSRLLDMCGYIGPAPVNLNAYTERILEQERTREPIDLELFQKSFADLVLSERVLQTLSLVVSSRRSLFMTGPPGNGKTSIAHALHSAMGGVMWIPYAIEVDGQIIKVFDNYCHDPVPANGLERYDQRWILIKRPRIMVGGELTIEEMDLIYSPTVRYYEAPFQMKSNGGTLVIDDFGRQRVDPRDLLNRWIIPLESHIDYLTLHTGKKIEVPFEQLLIFATNLDPDTLVDQAFLRRLGYRLWVEPPSAETYGAIFRHCAKTKGLALEPDLLDALLARYRCEGRDMRCCEPRDLTERCLDICRIENREPELTQDLLNLAWTSYFGVKGEEKY